MTDIRYKYVDSIRIGYDATHYTEIKNVVFFGDRLAGEGEGHVSLRRTPNIVNPVGVLNGHKWWEMILGLDSDNREAFYEQDIQEGASTAYAVKEDVENPEIDYFAVRIVKLDDTVETWTYESGKVYVTRVTRRIENRPVNHQTFTYRLLCIGLKEVS